MASLIMLIVALQLANFASCEPIVNFPLNSQLPPVARVDESFSYTFSPYTFKSDFELTYSLGDAPEWLSIDSSTGRLYGTPKDSEVPPGDVVGQPIQLMADDGTGQSSLNATLVISRNKAPTVKVPISEQIHNFGDYSAPSSLLSYPSTEFSYTFDPNTFEHQPNMINYYAASADNSPLPAWMKFDAASLTFSGITPSFESLIQPPQTFGFRLFASDIVGFSATDISFSLVVGSHKLSTESPTIVLNATLGKNVSYDGLADGIKVDNKPARPGDLDVSTGDMPEWLTLDSTTWEIKGKPGKGDHSTNFTINFRDSYSDTLNVEVIVNVETSLFRSSPDDVDFREGQDFDIDLRPYFWDPSDVNIKMTLAPQKDWLKLDGFKITGKVPKSASDNLNITIDASSKSSDLEETETFSVELLASTATQTSSTSQTSQTSASETSTETGRKSSEPSETSSTTEEGASGSDSKGLTTGEILLVTLLPILVISLLIMLLVCCIIRRRRAQRTYLSSKFRNKISGPVLESLRINGNAPVMQEVNSSYDVTALGQRPGREGYSELGSYPSRLSTGSLTTPELPSEFIAEESRERMARTISAVTEEARRSWVTVEGTEAATARRSQVSIRSAGSDTTFPESTHQLLPPPGFLIDSAGSSFRTGLDLAIPSLEDLPGMRQTEPKRTKAQTGSELFSTTDDSSLAFASSHQSSPRLVTGIFGKTAAETASDSRPPSGGMAPLLAEVAEEVSEVQRPGQARLSSQRSSRAWYDTESSSGHRSLQTDPSFGPSENWRVIGGSLRDAPSISYRKLVDAAPFHPNRFSTAMSAGREGAQPGERAGSPSSELISPSQWGDAKTSIRGSIASRIDVISKSGSRYSRLGDELPAKAPSRVSRLGGSASGAWRREDSARTEGSLKAFL
ncbi:Fc.00g099540.m01.CDS01 [Cosmosporella sp. VM-42]